MRNQAGAALAEMIGIWYLDGSYDYALVLTQNQTEAEDLEITASLFPADVEQKQPAVPT